MYHTFMYIITLCTCIRMSHCLLGKKKLYHLSVVVAGSKVKWSPQVGVQRVDHLMVAASCLQKDSAHLHKALVSRDVEGSLAVDPLGCGVGSVRDEQGHQLHLSS